MTKDSYLERLRWLVEAGDPHPVWEKIFDCIPDGVVVIDAETGIIVLANKALHQIFGYSWQLDDGEHVIETLLPKRFRRKHEELRKEYAKNPEVMTVTRRPFLYGLRKDGKEFNVRLELNYFEHGENKYLMASVRPI